MENATLVDEISSFGAYIKARREGLGVSLRNMATQLDLTAVYLGDIEKGNRYAPDKHLDKMFQVLKVPANESDLFYDLAGKSRNNQFSDINQYVGETDSLRKAIRLGRDNNAGEDFWQAVIHILEQQSMQSIQIECIPLLDGEEIEDKCG